MTLTLSPVHRQLAFAAALLALGLSGCGSSTPPLGTVSGRLTANGKPLAKARIEFQPAKGPPSFGFTDDDGKYSLYFDEKHAGAVLGEHKVSIRTTDLAQDDTESGGIPVEKVPQAYNQYTTLKATVKSGENVADFAIEFDEQAFEQLVQVRQQAQSRQNRSFTP